jgi:hypothetical protein
VKLSKVLPWLIDAVRRSPALRRAAIAFLNRVRSSAALQRHVVPKLIAVPGDVDADAASRETAGELAQVAASKGPVIVGPWLSEVGFELLYWIPFLNWCTAALGIAPERLVVLTRGGAAIWYRGLANRSIDILELMSTDEFRRLNERRIEDADGLQKHVEVSELDREILRRLAAKEGLGEGCARIHPSLMYNLYKHMWRRNQPVKYLLRQAEFRRLEPPPCRPEVACRLPPRYYVAKFYFSNCFRDAPETRRFIAEFLAGLSRRLPVVLLSTGIKVDDHSEWSPEGGGDGSILTISDLMTPATNLEVQTSVVARADAFVGTYGGFSYLAPFLGVTSTALVTEERYLACHFEVARAVFGGKGFGAFTLLRLEEVEHLRTLLC